MKTHRFLRSALCTAATLVAAANCANAQIASFNTQSASAAGCVAPASVGSTIISGASFIDLCRGPGISSNAAGNSYNSTGFNLNGDENAAVASGDYVSFGVTLSPGVQGNFTDVVFRAQRSNTGPRTLGLRSSMDNFSTTIATVTTVPTSATNVTFDFTDFQACGQAVEFRVYAWGATNASGTLRAMGPTAAIVINGNADVCGGGGPTGACCLPNGTCIVTTTSACTTSSGNYAGDSVTCDAANCPPPATGGCCVAGICQGVFTQADCLSFSGTWGGANTDCSTFICPETTGTCCIAGNCTITTQATCTSGGGSWSVGSSCGPTTCPAVGACCVGTTCTLTDFASCGGTWLGRGVACGANACVRPALAANVIAVDDFDLQRDATSFTLTRVSDGAALPAPIVAQLFGIGQRFRTTPEPMPFALLDDTTSVFTGDIQGIIRESKVDNWFGATNMYTEMAGDGTPDDPTQRGEDEVQATWTFNIAGRSNLSIAMDLAAMGDFEGVNCSAAPECVADRYTFAVSIDGGPFTDLFVIRPDEAIDQNYTLASGASFTLPDPMKLDGTTVLTNIFTTFSKNVAGTGNVLTLRLRGQADGGTDEAFAFDNLVVRGDVAPTTGACCTAGNCTVTTEALCNLGGGTFTSVGSVCNAGTCNTAPTPCQIADFNDSGSVTADDIFAFLDAWFAQNGQTGPGLSADVNFSDAVTADDIFAYLDLWFAQNGQNCN